MGSIREHDLTYYINKYRLDYYVETGTGEGECLAYAVQHPFKKFFTVDIDEDLVKRVYGRFAKLDKSIQLHVGKSTDFLRELVPTFEKDARTLFFLDAHFPGADFHKCTYEESIRLHKQDAFPLEEEVKILLEKRDVSKDVFILDDFILYEEGDYETIQQGVTWKYDWLQEELNLQTCSQFLYDAFDKTHEVKKDLRSQGYLILTPKQSGSL